MTPKSLLRLPAATSPVAELVDGAFHEILDDRMFDSARKRQNVKRILMCSGKVYYDLAARREQTGRDDVAIVRVEQLYPLHLDLLESVLTAYPEEAELLWVQEEPRNMGAWGHMALSMQEAFEWDLSFIGRAASATPATGSPRKHREELDAFLTDAIGSKEGVAAGA